MSVPSTNSAPTPAGRPLRITFVLPNPIRIPMGGPKIVYGLAEGLAARGHRVRVVGPERSGATLAARAKALAVRARDRWHGVEDQPYYEAPGVENCVVPSPRAVHFPDGDAVIATGYQTADWVAALPPSKGVGCYLVQNKEDYLPGGTHATASWRLPLAKVTPARWLRREIEAAGERAAAPIEHGVDPAEFFVERPLENRPARLVLLYHRLAIKGPEDAIGVLERVKAARPDVEADVFCARPPSHELPPWARVHIRPSTETLRALYSGAAVFLHTSHREGRPLCPLEAAACGTPTVAAANDGIREYFDGTTAWLCPVGDVEALTAAVLAALADEPARLQMARSALARVGTFSWERCTDAFERFLYDHL